MKLARQDYLEKRQRAQREAAERAAAAARQEAEARRREAAVRAAAARAMQQRRQEVKRVGDAVCLEGNIALGLIHVRIKGFVEGVSGDRIQIRVADTQGQSIHYKGVMLAAERVIWDDRWEWARCQ